MAWRTGRQTRGLAAILALALVLAASTSVHRLVSIGVGYEAGMVCSGLFVSHRPLADVLADLHADDLAILERVGVSVDSATSTVHASALGLVRRTAAYEPDYGCTLRPSRVSASRSPTVTHRVVTGPAADGRASSDGSVPADERVRSGNARLESAIDEAFSEPDRSRLRRTRAVVVMQNGQVVSERYSPGISIGTPMIGWSMSKSVMNALVGALVRQGRMTLDGTVRLPEWSGPGDGRRGITIDQLLRMSSGLEFDEDMTNPLADVTRMLLLSGDMSGFAVNKRLVHEPGTTWQYSSGTSNIIARAVRMASDPDEYRALPRREIFEPLGMSGAVIELDDAGTFVGSSFVFATAREWARFGQLYLQDGILDGRRILPEGWVAYTRTPAPADSTRRYGAHFWLRIPDEYAGGGSRRVPEDAFHAAGHGGQFVSIVPSCDVVVVRLGVSRMPGSWDHARFLGAVLDALGCSSGNATA